MIEDFMHNPSLVDRTGERMDRGWKRTKLGLCQQIAMQLR